MKKFLEESLKPFRRFQVKVTVAMILSLLFVVALSDALIYQYVLHSQFNALRERLMVIAQISTLTIDPGVLSAVPLNKDGVHSAEYKAVAAKLIQIKQANPLVKYIYIMIRTGKKGSWHFWVDPEPAGSSGGPTSYPGDPYDAGRFPEMLKAFQGPTADRKVEEDEWGPTLSGYAPIYNHERQPIAILGVDVSAQDVYTMQNKIHQRGLMVLFCGLLLSLAVGALISRRITTPLSELEEGARHIALGNFQHQVRIDGDDEINELASAFNHMAKSVDESRKRLMNYFYDVVRSLVKVLEVKDQYTTGHSEMVAEYAGKIALKLGYPQETVELLKKMTLLHDIGKLGVHESILNKQGPLTDAEWEVMRTHPLIGEEIVRPILSNPEMLAVIRGHHERYDGKGYPDQLSRDNINIFAAIVSVADAYHAMTSDRPYRLALTKSHAMQELKKNSGTQFHPDVVNIFLEVLSEQNT
jgi:putative nucleotidyltransferase with HDIG domain